MLFQLFKGNPLVNCLGEPFRSTESEHISWTFLFYLHVFRIITGVGFMTKEILTHIFDNNNISDLTIAAEILEENCSIPSRPDHLILSSLIRKRWFRFLY